MPTTNYFRQASWYQSMMNHHDTIDLELQDDGVYRKPVYPPYNAINDSWCNAFVEWQKQQLSDQLQDLMVENNKIVFPSKNKFITNNQS